MYLAKQRDIELPMLGGILPSNRQHIELAISKVMATGKRRVGMIGLSFKPGTDDLRESPLVALAEHLIGKGLELRVYDPEVHLSRLLGANKSFIERHVPHLGQLLCEDIGDVIGASDVLVVGLATPEIVAALERLAEERHAVIDLAHLRDPSALKARYEGLCW
jgi:GDP-mannose 6-dehydrogenase